MNGDTLRAFYIIRSMGVERVVEFTTNEKYNADKKRLKKVDEFVSEVRLFKGIEEAKKWFKNNR